MMKNRLKILISVIVIILLLTTSLTGCQLAVETDDMKRLGISFVVFLSLLKILI